jgi:PRD1 phage membrane DNA delivery
MNNITKVLTAIVGVALVTALVLPGRQTAQVLNAAGNVFSNSLNTAIKG